VTEECHVASGEEKTLVTKVWLRCDGDYIIVRCEVPWKSPFKVAPERVQIAPAPNGSGGVDPSFEYTAPEDSEERVIVIDSTVTEYALK